MKIAHCEQIDAATVELEGAVGTRIRRLIGPDDGAPNFAMRMFEVSPDGHTPKHSHAHEHEVFVLKGEGTVLCGDTEHALRPGVVVFVPPQEVHRFSNTSTTTLKLLCMVPNSGC